MHHLIAKRCLDEYLVSDLTYVIIKLIIQLYNLTMQIMEYDIKRIIGGYYYLLHKENNTYYYVYNERIFTYDTLTFIPKITSKYQLYIQVSHCYDQSHFDRLRSKIDQHIKGTKYRLLKGRRFKWCIEMID